jgi:plastocyanin
MSLPVKRPARLTLAAAAATLAITLAPSSAAAATLVKMNNSYSFNPKEISIDRGTAVRWKNFGSFQDHDVRSLLPNYFRSPGGVGGLDQGESYTFTFRSAGTFAYVCKAHQPDGMFGEVVVPISVSKLTNPVRFRIYVATQSASSPFTHVIEVDKPGPSGWTVLRTTTASSYTFKPAKHGTFRFRARVRNTSAGVSSAPSPVRSLTW